MDKPVEMTDTQLNIEIAKILGWTVKRVATTKAPRRFRDVAEVYVHYVPVMPSGLELHWRAASEEEAWKDIARTESWSVKLDKAWPLLMEMVNAHRPYSLPMLEDSRRVARDIAENYFYWKWNWT